MKKFGIILITVVLMLLCGCNRIAVNSMLNDFENIIEDMEEIEEKYEKGKLTDAQYMAKYASLMNDYQKLEEKLYYIDETDLSTKQYEKFFELMDRLDKLYSSAYYY